MTPATEAGGESVHQSAFTICTQVASKARVTLSCWAEAHIKIARMTLTIKLDRNWSSFQLANRAPPLSVTDSSIAPSARMLAYPIAHGDVLVQWRAWAPVRKDPRSIKSRGVSDEVTHRLGSKSD